MLESVVWRRVRAEWSEDLEMKPKFSMLRRIVKCGVESSCTDVKAKREGIKGSVEAKGRHSGFSSGDRQVAGSEERG